MYLFIRLKGEKMFKVLTKGCEPTRGSKYSACVDLYASEDVVIGAGDTKLVGLGVAIDLNEKKYFIQNYLEKQFSIVDRADEEYFFNHFLRSHYLQLMLRSSLAKKGLIIANGVGVIDLDFRDEIKIAIHNPITEQNFIQDDNAYITDPFEHTEYKIKKGDRIAQIALLEHKSHLFGIESDEERKGGFGSTGG